MPALDLALGLRMIRRSVDMLDVLLVQPIGKIARDIRRAVVRQEPWPVNDVHLIEPGRRQRQIECGGDILRFHSRAELPGDNEAREVVEHGREIVPAPPHDLEIGVSRPKEFRLRPLAEPDVNLSAHPAPIIHPTTDSPSTNEPMRGADVAPAV